jgi:hypothetical protein
MFHGLRPVRVHEAVVERVVEALLARELGHAEREARVRDDRRPVVGETGSLESLAHRILLADADAVAAMQVCERNPLRRILRMEIEGEPADLGAELAPCLLGRHLAEPAEGSDVVAPDVDRVLCHLDVQRVNGRYRFPVGSGSTAHRAHDRDRLAPVVVPAFPAGESTGDRGDTIDS